MDLKKWLSGKILVAAHIGDTDACASFVAFSEFVKEFSDADFDYHVSGKLNKDGQKILNLFKFKPNPKINLSEYEKIIMLDTPLNIVPEEFQKFKDLILIDHHQYLKGGKANGIIDSNAVSVTQIIYSLFKEYKVKLSEKAAKAIIYGIISDTGGMRFAKTDTFKIVYEILSENKLEYMNLLEDLASEVELQERIACLKAGSRLELKKLGNTIVAISSVKSFESSAASKLITLGADVSLIIARKNTKDVRIVGRARKGFNLADIFINASQQIGGTGGGHPLAAVINTTADKEEETLNFILKWLKSQKS